MPLSPLNVEQFGGLNLRDDPEEVGLDQAIDLLNVDLDRFGRVRTRDGTSAFAAATLANGSMLPFYSPAGTRQLIAEGTGVFRAISTAGTVVAASTGFTGEANPNGMVNFAAPGSTYAYCCSTGGDIRRWDGTTWTVPGGVPASYMLAIQPSDNRLVAVSTANTSRVKFSDAGAPETFGANNYVDLTPGDGLPISGMAVFNGMLFVFKRSRYYIFYGNSVDGTGNPVFNYRTVDVGIGAFDTAGNVCVGPDGVYFIGYDGVYLTTGGPPTKISGPLDPYFALVTTPYFSPTFGGMAEASGYRLSYVRNRLYVALRGKTFVFDPRTNFWTYWDLTLKHVVEFSIVDGVPVIMFSSYTGATHARYLDATVTTDSPSAAAITSRYRSGFSDLGFPGREKTIRETELVGSGSVSFAWSRDLAAAVTSTSTATATLGTAPVVARRLHRKSQDGELFSWQASSVAGSAWTLNRLTPFAREVRGPAEPT